MDLTIIVVTVSIAGLLLILAYVFFFMPDMDEDEKAVHEHWQRAADELGVTHYPKGAERLFPFVSGQIDGRDFHFAFNIAQEATRVFDARGRAYRPPLPTMLFRISLHPMWTPYIKLLLTRLKGKMYYVSIDLQLMTETATGKVRFEGIPFAGMKSVLEGPRITGAILRAAELFDEISIDEQKLYGRILSTDLPSEDLVRAARELVALSDLLTDVAMEHSEFRDERYAAPTTSAESSW